MKRFAIFPSTIRSRGDGQEHLITGGDLIRLYGVPAEDCVIVRDSDEQYDRELMPLHPLPNGDYKKSLEQRKANDFQEYIKARKLRVFHAEGRSPHKHLREVTVDRLDRSIAWHERHWPDFRDVYDRHYGKN